MNPLRIVKLIGSWGCIIAATALLVLTPGNAFGLPGVLGILGIAFAEAPETF